MSGTTMPICLNIPVRNGSNREAGFIRIVYFSLLIALSEELKWLIL